MRLLIKKKPTIKKMVFFAAVCLLLASVWAAVCNPAGNNLRSFFGGYSAEASDASQLTVDSQIKTKYLPGEILDVPDAFFEYNGKVYSATAVLLFPDGKAASQSRFTLSQAGRYVLEYRSQADNGIFLSKKKEFDVLPELYSVSSTKSSAAYGAHSYAPDKNGIVVSLAAGDTFTFNKVISLNNRVAADSIIRLFATPQIIGVADASNINITFTDAYNPDNYVTVTFKEPPQPTKKFATYMSVCAYNQVTTGIENASKIHKNDPYGAVGRFSLTGEPQTEKGEGGIGDTYAEVSWNYSEKTVYGTTNASGTIANPGRPANAVNTIIAKLDDPALFDTLWHGFSTGEVYISISAAKYQVEKANYVISYFDGIDLSTNAFEIDSTPILEVDNLGYSSVPNAVVGLPYKIYGASAVDGYQGSLEVKKQVFFDYRGANQVNCNLTGDYFTPNRAGKYTVVYTAENILGAKDTCEIEITAVEKTEGQRLQFNYTGFVSSGAAGQEYRVVTDAEITNNIGDKKLKMTAQLVSDPSVVYDISASDYTFIPLYAGEYKIEFNYSDYVQNLTKSETITVVDGDVPLITVKPRLPNYVVKGSLIEIPYTEAYEFSSGAPVRLTLPPVITVKEDGGNPKAITGSTYRVNALNTIEIICTYTANTQTATASASALVVDTGYGTGNFNMEKYFDVTKGSIASSLTDSSISYKTSVNGSELTFINELQALDFQFIFNVNKDYNAFNAVNIYLTDSLDENITLKITYKKTPSNQAASYFNLNGGMNYSVNSNFFGKDNELFYLRYVNSDLTLWGSASISIQADKTMQNKPFDGFPSGKIILKIEFEGVTGQSELILYKLNNQPLYEESKDYIEPQLFYDKMNDERTIGDYVTLTPAYSFDVLNSSSLKISVKAPDGSYVVSEDGITLNGVDAGYKYTFKINAYGNYTVSYEAKDGSERSNRKVQSYIIRSKDKVKPEITLTNIVESAKKGANVKIANVEVLNKTGCTIFATVETPEGIITKIAPGDSFKAEISGVYKVNYIVIDSIDNRTYAGYRIIVS